MRNRLCHLLRHRRSIWRCNTTSSPASNNNWITASPSCRSWCSGRNDIFRHTTIFAFPCSNVHVVLICRYHWWRRYGPTRFFFHLWLWLGRLTCYACPCHLFWGRLSTHVLHCMPVLTLVFAIHDTDSLHTLFK